MKFPIWFSAALISASVATAEPKPGNLNATEQWILMKLASGEVANLEKASADGKLDRQLTSHFVESLLTGSIPGFKPHRNGLLIVGAVINDPINLRNAQIVNDVSLDRCEFISRVSFVHANFLQNASFTESTFRADADFVGLKVGYSLYLNGTKFEQGATFGAVEIRDSLQAEGARFKNKENAANFNYIKVGKRVIFIGAVFSGGLDLVAGSIGDDINFEEADFANETLGVSFGMTRVGGSAFFRRAIFEGPVDFERTNVSGDFEAQGSEFRNESETVWLAMKCSRQGVFREIKFAGPVSFAESSFLDLVIAESESPVPELDLSHCLVERQLRIGLISVATLTAASLRVEDLADLSSLKTIDSADLTNSRFGTLDLSGCEWPDDASKFHVEGMTYKYIRAAKDEHDSPQALLKLGEKAAYTVDMYSNLEQFFLKQGNRADADRAFIAGKRRERSERLHGLSWAGSLLLDWLVGYGRHPERAGYVCLAVIALGCLLFPSRKMKLRDPAEGSKPEDVRPQYNRLWYSLGLFLPVVDLQTSELWKPGNEHTFLQFYVRLHILMGWIFVPIFLAAISGLIK